MRRTFILHASGAKLPTDLLGLTCVRYDGSTTAAEMKVVCQKLRKAIENEGRVARIEGMWWQFSLTQRSEGAFGRESSARFRGTAAARWRWPAAHGRRMARLSARYWSEAVKEKEDASGIFYYWKGERPLHPNAPQLEGRARSGWSPPTAHRDTSRHVRIRTRT